MAVPRYANGMFKTIGYEKRPVRLRESVCPCRTVSKIVNNKRFSFKNI